MSKSSQTYEDVEGPADDDWLELGLEVFRSLEVFWRLSVSRSLEVFWFPDAPWASVLPDINDDSKAQRAVKGVNKSHM